MKKIFVFGSNTEGRHGKGAALHALRNCGAIYGQAEGLQGRSYAIPTMSGDPHPKPLNPKPLSLNEIQGYVWVFLQFTLDHPELTFQVTPIGCGLAGFKPEQIAPMFRLNLTGYLPRSLIQNIEWPEEFKAYL